MGESASKAPERRGCPHKNNKVYALDMCHSCYHKFGKPKKASDCPHTDMPHYASGVCQKCYLARYYLQKKKPQIQAKLRKKQLEQAARKSTSLLKMKQ